MDWTQYTTLNIGFNTYYLIKNIDDQLCIAVKVSDTLTDGGSDVTAGQVYPLHIVNTQLDNLNS